MPKPLKKLMKHLLRPWQAPKRRQARQLFLEFLQGTYASKKFGYVFMGNHKVCSSRIKSDLHVLEGFALPEHFNHVHTRPERLQNHVKSLLDWSPTEVMQMVSSPDYLRFSFVRNPYERLYSGYRSKIATGDPNYDFLHRHIVEERKLICALGQKHYEAIRFEDFAHFVCQQDDEERDHHWKNQGRVLLMDMLDYNFIGRYESFDQDYTWVLKKLGAPQSTLDQVQVKVNATDAHQTWRKAYTPELADMVFSSYEADFTSFNYEKSSWLGI